MNTLASIYLPGMAVALVLALRFACAQTENRPAAMAFAGFLGCSAVFLWDAGFLAAGLFQRWPVLYGWSEPFILAIGPFFFLYARATTEPAFVWRPKALVHFIGPLLWLPLLVLWLLVPEAERLAEVSAATGAAEAGPQTTADAVILVLANTYHLGYLGAAWRRLWLRRERVAEEQEEGRSHPVRGIGLFATLVLAIAVVSAVLDFSPWAGTGNGLVALAIVLIVFGLLWSMMQPRPFLGRASGARDGAASLLPAAASVSTSSAGSLATESTGDPAVDAVAARPEPINGAAPLTTEPVATLANPAESFESSAGVAGGESPAPPERRREELKPDELAALVKRIRRALVQERVFLDPELSLQQLAARVGTTRHKLSAALRDGFGGSFHQLVSGMRVREAATILRTREGAAQTIAAVAFSAGFNTLSAFNAAFRAHFGMTPREYRDAGTAEQDAADRRASG